MRVEEQRIAVDRVAIGGGAYRVREASVSRRALQERREGADFARAELAECRHGITPLRDDLLNLLWCALNLDQGGRVRRGALARGAVACRAGAVVDLTSKGNGVSGGAGHVVHRPEPIDRRRLVDVDIQHVEHGIEAPAMPFRAPEMPRRRDRALQTGRREDRPGLISPEILQSLRVRLGRDVREVRLRQVLTH